ncbi:hypothetical protein VTO42DRAFT_3861 [Malbranchea cinnamomea]
MSNDTLPRPGSPREPVLDTHHLPAASPPPAPVEPTTAKGPGEDTDKQREQLNGVDQATDTPLLAEKNNPQSNTKAVKEESAAPEPQHSPQGGGSEPRDNANPKERDGAAVSKQTQRPQPTAETATPTARKQTNGTIGSVYSGNKIRHLKKEDGVPLWRKDIQYRFLRMVFEDTTPVFTRFPDGKTGFSFADIYIDAMAKSSKTSKILKEKLQTDRPAAIQMAMVCLLVNFGRMNTTLNFFPEMRAQLRTYHPIPSLQAHNDDSSAYKQLQDAPRLKSILKGASEDVEQPGTIEKIKSAAIPRTNPVNLIFVMSQFAPKVSELHFPPPRDFFDLVMGATLSSRSRARAFLWLMWYYLESDFSKEAALANPFGPGLVGEGTDGLPLKVPELEILTEEEADAENVDTPEEIQFGEEKQKERKRILVDDDVLFRYSKRHKKGTQGYVSDDQISEDVQGAKGERQSSGGRRGNEEHLSAMSTPLNPPSKRGAADDEEDWRALAQTARPRAKRAKRDSSINRPLANQPQRLVLKTRMDHTPDTASPAPPGPGHPVLYQFNGSPATMPRRPRPLTQHQLALEQNRRQRVEYALAQRRNKVLETLRAQRESEVPFFRAGRLLQSLPEDYDTDEENSWGKGGICPNPQEEEDFGESASFFLSVLRKTARRLQRWDWDAIAAGETETWVNSIGRGRYKSESWNTMKELETAPEATPPTVKRGRGGRRKATDAVVEGEKPATGRRGGRVSAVGGRKRGSGDGPTRKPRLSGRVLKTTKPEGEEEGGEPAEMHDHTPAPVSRAQSPVTHVDEDNDHDKLEEDAQNESRLELDDLDREEVLGEVSGGEETELQPSERRDLVAVETLASAVGPEEQEEAEEQEEQEHDEDDNEDDHEDYHEDDNEDDNEDEVSSAYHDQVAAPETSQVYDTDPMTEEEVGSSIAGGNDYAEDETSSVDDGDMDTALEGNGDGDGDETMVDA